MKKLTLKGKPISVNSLYKGRRFLTKKGSEVKKDYEWQVLAQTRAQRLNLGGKYSKPEGLYYGPVAVKAVFYFNANRGDIDNVLKMTLDSLKGYVYEDDKQITELYVFKKVDKFNPRTELEIWEIKKN